MHSPEWPRILSEDLTAPAEPLALLLRPGSPAHPRVVARLAARALLGPVEGHLSLPAWLAPHQEPAARRLCAILDHYGGALLADAVGLGKSYVALAVALARREPFALVVPAVLVDQWRALLASHRAEAPIVTHESLSVSPVRRSARPPVRLLIVDEAHRFRNPTTRRYGALAMLAVGARVLLVTATPVHNLPGDLFHLFRLFLRDHAMTGLGLPSLARAARGDAPPELVAPVVARLTVARSRQRVRVAYAPGALSLAFPERGPSRVVRAGPLPDAQLEALVGAIRELAGGAHAAALFRLMLLARLASSVPAFRDSVGRYEAYLELALSAAREGRALGPREFQRLFPERDGGGLQLALFPILLEAGPGTVGPDDLVSVRRLRGLPSDAGDPKAAALETLIAAGGGKTIVFATARATVRHLARRLAPRRVAALLGDGGLLGGAPATAAEVLRAFAPQSQGAPPPRAALETDLLIATDLLSEGLNLQDAVRVIHYDLPWTPARLAQRVGRIDRLGSPHDAIETVTFLPPAALAEALRLEERLAVKARAHLATIGGAVPASDLDWCDRLEPLAREGASCTAGGAFAAVGEDTAGQATVVLVVRLGERVEAIVVDRNGARPDPAAAARLLESAASAEPRRTDRAGLVQAIEQAAPGVRSRLNAIAEARWRAADRDRPGRRLIPWMLAAARAASRRGDASALARIDCLVSRLAGGMTAGEELLLAELLERPVPLSARDLVAWHEGLPPAEPPAGPPHAELVAALLVLH